MYKHLLVPTDGSDLSNQTIGKGVAFAKEVGAKVTFFYAVPDYLATDDGALMRTISPKFAAENIPANAHAILMKAETAARAAHVTCSSLYKISDHPYEAIIRTSVEQGCDLIFMASRGPKSIGGLLLGSETLKVLTHSTIPVLVSSVSRNSSTPEMDISIGIIQDEHRSLGAVLHGMKYVIDDAANQGVAPDFGLLRLMLHYIREFPEKLHHPKEDNYIFSRLRQRTNILDDVIAKLEQDHANQSVFDVFETELLLYEGAGESRRESFLKALKDYSESQWKHMRLEEESILPAAKIHLFPEDWRAIADAFRKNGDPRFTADADSQLKGMFATLARLSHQAEKR